MREPGRRIGIACIVGARPNFMKMAPIMAALGARPIFDPRLIHTGQHYDYEMDAVFFQQLGLPQPDVNLEVGSGTQTEQTARIMLGLEQAFLDRRPDLVLVVGDVNSTLAAALVGSKLGIPIAHVEAGLRSNDRTMPEELNRLVTDRLSDLLFTTEREAGTQLEREGVAPQAIHFVGNVMIDCLLANLDRAVPMDQALIHRGVDAERAGLVGRRYALVTLHRPSNVDNPEQLAALLRALGELSQEVHIVFAMHPRTRARIGAAGLEPLLAIPGICAVSPLSYFEMAGAMQGAALAITDSGGVQEETTALGVPCLTVRDNTERPITLSEGTNILVGSSAEAMLAAARQSLSQDRPAGRIPELWDGHAAERIAAVLEDYLA